MRLTFFNIFEYQFPNISDDKPTLIPYARSSAFECSMQIHSSLLQLCL